MQTQQLKKLRCGGSESEECRKDSEELLSTEDLHRAESDKEGDVQLLADSSLFMELRDKDAMDAKSITSEAMVNIV